MDKGYLHQAIQDLVGRQQTFHQTYPPKAVKPGLTENSDSTVTTAENNKKQSHKLEDPSSLEGETRRLSLTVCPRKPDTLADGASVAASVSSAKSPLNPKAAAFTLQASAAVFTPAAADSVPSAEQEKTVSTGNNQSTKKSSSSSRRTRSREWACERCTLLNAAKNTRCDVCNAARPRQKQQPAQQGPATSQETSKQNAPVAPQGLEVLSSTSSNVYGAAGAFDDPNDPKNYFFYQSTDGALMFMHSYNYRCLKKQVGL